MLTVCQLRTHQEGGSLHESHVLRLLQFPVVGIVSEGVKNFICTSELASLTSARRVPCAAP